MYGVRFSCLTKGFLFSARLPKHRPLGKSHWSYKSRRQLGAEALEGNILDVSCVYAYPQELAFAWVEGSPPFSESSRLAQHSHPHRSPPKCIAQYYALLLCGNDVSISLSLLINWQEEIQRGMILSRSAAICFVPYLATITRLSPCILSQYVFDHDAPLSSSDKDNQYIANTCGFQQVSLMIDQVSAWIKATLENLQPMSARTAVDQITYNSGIFFDKHRHSSFNEHPWRNLRWNVDFLICHIGLAME